MLVFGFAGKSASLSDHIKPNDGGVTFNTIPMKLKVQYPTSTDIGAPVGVDSEIWYLYNPDYSATGASSGSLTGTVGAGVTGTIGATITGVLSTTSTTGTIAKNKSEISGTTGSFSPGQHLVSGPVCTGFTYGPTTTILSINTPGNGNINLTNITQPTVNCTGTFTFSSNVLNVTALTGALFPAGSYSGYGGDTVSGTTISAQLTGSPTGGVGTYTISDSSGFPLTVTNVAVTSNMLKVTSLPTTGTLYPAGTYSSYVYAGDTISGATINSQVTGNPAGGVGTYRLNGAAQGLVTLTAAAVTSPLFNATAASAIGVGDTIAGGTVVDNPTISKVGTVNTYSAPYVLSANEGPTGTTTLKNKAISVPGGTVAPVAGTILAVSTATGGVFPPNTIVLSAATGAPADPTATKFYVSAIPTTVLNNDAICGGTCAFFQHNPAGSMTTFTLDLSTGTGILGNSWASGFTCLKGADGTQETVYVTKLPPNRWTEVIKN